MTHTPGPWTYEVHRLSEGFSAIVYGANGYALADHLDEDTARLIAAAPEMLQALKFALLEFQKPAKFITPIERETALNRMRAVIAKAEGRP